MVTNFPSESKNGFLQKVEEFSTDILEVQVCFVKY